MNRGAEVSFTALMQSQCFVVEQLRLRCEVSSCRCAYSTWGADSKTSSSMASENHIVTIPSIVLLKSRIVSSLFIASYLRAERQRCHGIYHKAPAPADVIHCRFK